MAGDEYFYRQIDPPVLSASSKAMEKDGGNENNTITSIIRQKLIA